MFTCTKLVYTLSKANWVAQAYHACMFPLEKIRKALSPASPKLPYLSLYYWDKPCIVANRPGMPWTV